MRYRVSTWDIEIQDFTPQIGVAERHLTVGVLKAALRRLRRMGYSAHRSDSYVLVERDPYPLIPFNLEDTP